MKKAYSKPDILFDSFSMSVSIAACQVTTDFARGDCGYSFIPGIVIFLEGVNGCQDKVVDNSAEGNSLCYHNYDYNNSLFTS